MMVTAKRNRKRFWLRSLDEAQGVTVYSEPVRVNIPLYPMTGEADLIALGAEYNEHMRARLSSKEALKYSIGDLIYELEPEFDSMIDVGNAAYHVTALLTTLDITEMRCRRLSGSEP